MQDVYSPAVLDLAGDPGIEAFSSLQRELESEVDLLKSAVITDFWFPYRCGSRAWGSPMFVQFGGLSLRKRTQTMNSQIWGFENNNWGSSLASWCYYPKTEFASCWVSSQRSGEGRIYYLQQVRSSLGPFFPEQQNCSFPVLQNWRSFRLKVHAYPWRGLGQCMHTGKGAWAEENSA